MQIEITTPDKTIFEGEGSLIQLPGIDGLFEVLNNHAPMIYILKKGSIKIKDQLGELQYFEINGGVVEVRKNLVKVLAE